MRPARGNQIAIDGRRFQRAILLAGDRPAEGVSFAFAGRESNRWDGFASIELQ